jgi:hypothetical protein
MTDIQTNYWDAPAPPGHVYLARGPGSWATGKTRAQAKRGAKLGLLRPQADQIKIRVQCFPEDVAVSEVSGEASWSKKHDAFVCPHCEPEGVWLQRQEQLRSLPA